MHDIHIVGKLKLTFSKVWSLDAHCLLFQCWAETLLCVYSHLYMRTVLWVGKTKLLSLYSVYTSINVFMASMIRFYQNKILKNQAKF